MTTKPEGPRASRWSVVFSAALAVVAALVPASQVYAFGGILSTFNSTYPGSSSGANAGCQLCHGSSTSTWNEYGWGLRQNGQNFAALEGLPSVNINGGTTMLDEINASTQPGWTTGANNNLYNSGGLITSTQSPPGGIGTLDPAANVPPMADANGPYNGTAGLPVTFDGSGSTDSDGTIVAYDWDFGDGNTGTGVSPTHTYAAAGTYTVTLTVTDDGGATDSATSTANIVAAPEDPIADPNGPYTGTEGVALTLDGSGSFDPDGGAITAYDWDFGDGTTGTGVSPTHTYAAAGTYTVTLTVVDDEGAISAPVSTTATIDPAPANLPPTSDPNGPYTGTAGQPVSFDGSGSSDPDGSIVTYDWDFGDGNTGTGVSPTHTYAAPGSYLVTLTVTDDGTPAESATTTTTATIEEAGAVCEGLNISRARYNARNDRLQVRGDGGERNGGDFVLTNAYDPGQVLAEGSRDRDRIFNFSVMNPDPVPCAVRVEQPETGLCAIAEVDDAPEDCSPQGPPGPPAEDLTARGDLYATPVGDTLEVVASRLSGVLYNDFGGVPPLTAQLISGPSAGSLDAFGADGSFTYTPGASMIDNEIDQFTYVAVDDNGKVSDPATVVIQALSKQVDFKITMNYELGMHCTGFEFAYCCVLPPYNSILAQVIKPAQGDPSCAQEEDGCNDFLDGYPRLLEGDPNAGLDGLNRETVVRDWDHTNNSFKKYQLRYYHDAQPRQEGNTSKPNTSTLISDVEGNSLQYFNTVFDSAQPDGGNALVYGPYNGYQNVIQGSGVIGDVPTDNYANAWLNHFYIYTDPDTGAPNLEGHGATGLEGDKIRLGVAGQVAYPANSGAALQPMGPTGNGAFENLLTFSADTGTVVYTQAKVLEDLPIMLTSPRIWEALGLPLTPFEDTINFFGDPGAVDEDAVRPYVAMKASLHDYPSGDAVMGSNGEPVIGFGTAPIDIPNCERCHSAPSINPATGLPNINSPNWNRGDAFYPHGGPLAGTGLEDMTDLEYNFWLAYYDIVPGVDSDWYARLKGAAINMLTLHDFDVGTSFTANYAGVECTNNPDPTDPTIDPQSYGCSYTNGLADLTNQSNIPQNTRLGNESVICQRCHADNVIANVKSATFDAGGQFPIPPITEAIHNQHRNQSEGGVIVFNDALGRDGGCQGCHPAHRSDGVMDGYPITLGGDNFNADGDNRLNPGGCFVGRDVHSNPLKDSDGAETPSHLNAVGGWLADNVFYNQAGKPGGTADNRGIWCTNCHSQLSQEIWRTEDCNDLIRGDCLVNPRGEPTLEAVANAVGWTLQQAIDSLDPLTDPNDPTQPGPGRTADLTHAKWDPANTDADVATIEVDAGGNPVVTTDADGDISVNILSFCTTEDCVDRINNNKSDQSQWRYPANAFIDPVNNMGAAVPFSAATDGRDHWLSAGEPHCADCHKAPYVEQSGNFSPYPPFNYPAKASLMRYTRGHQDVSCQGCHESIHGLYPVTPTIDTTSYAQAAALNNDGSHGPLKCAACHTHVDASGIPTWVDELKYNDPTTPGNDNLPVAGDFDRAVSWMHTYTAEADPNQDVCQNCHEDESDEISVEEEEYLEHAMVNRVSRVAMDAAERAINDGKVFGEEPGPQRDQLCTTCHRGSGGDRDDDDHDRRRRGDGGGNQPPDVNSCSAVWRRHLIEGRVSQVVWEDISEPLGGCGW
jgi:PKD repeat protein